MNEHTKLTHINEHTFNEHTKIKNFLSDEI